MSNDIVAFGFDGGKADPMANMLKIKNRGLVQITLCPLLPNDQCILLVSCRERHDLRTTSGRD